MVASPSICDLRVARRASRTPSPARPRARSRSTAAGRARRRPGHWLPLRSRRDLPPGKRLHQRVGGRARLLEPLIAGRWLASPSQRARVRGYQPVTSRSAPAAAEEDAWPSSRSTSTRISSRSRSGCTTSPSRSCGPPVTSGTRKKRRRGPSSRRRRRSASTRGSSWRSASRIPPGCCSRS